MLKTESKTRETTSFEVPPIKSSTIIGGAGSTKLKESDFYPTPEKATIEWTTHTFNPWIEMTGE